MKKPTILSVFNGFKKRMEAVRAKEPIDIICYICEELKEKLSPELLSLHQKYVNALEDSWAEELDFYFSEGFKLGLLIGVECAEE